MQKAIATKTTSRFPVQFYFSSFSNSFFSFSLSLYISLFHSLYLVYAQTHTHTHNHYTQLLDFKYTESNKYLNPTHQFQISCVRSRLRIVILYYGCSVHTFICLHIWQYHWITNFYLFILDFFFLFTFFVERPKKNFILYVK